PCEQAAKVVAGGGEHGGRLPALQEKNTSTIDLKVSAQALAIRLEELGRAKPGFNARVIRKPTKKKAPGGGYVRTRLSEIGGRFTALAITRMRERDSALKCKK